MAVRFLPKLGRERSHGLFFVVDLSPVPAVLCDAAQTGQHRHMEYLQA